MHAGNLLTTDPGGPYNFSLLNTQTTEVRGGMTSCSWHDTDFSVHRGEVQILPPALTVCTFAAAIAFKKDLTDMDIIHFLTNVECLEGQFDTWGTFG